MCRPYAIHCRSVACCQSVSLFGEVCISLHFVSLCMEYGWDTKFTACLFGHGFLRRDFTNRHENWHEASPMFQTGLLKFWSDVPRDGETVALLGHRMEGYAFC